MSRECHASDDLRAFLERIAGLPPRIAAEAASADQKARWGRGDKVPAERYLEALPQVVASPEDALLVIYGEARLAGAGTVNLRRFRGPYPHLADQLDALAEVHNALQAGGLSATGTDLSQAPSAPSQPPDTTPESPRPVSPPPAAPALPGYEMVRLLGKGGMGVVWEARQGGLNRRVALKLIRSADLAGAEEEARFLSEAEALAAVEHPNVVRVYEVGRHDRQPYMAMEFVEGGSLAGRLRQGPPPPPEAARVLEQVAWGVQAAHDRGIIHRDLKPANLLLAADGTPKITDFGLAKRLESGPGLTQTGVVMGTPSYMAPEQARGDAKRVGPAADVYGLGAVLYECLTGRPPFVGPVTVDVLVQVVNDDPVPVRALAPKAPRDLETICHRCLNKDPARRYASARDLAEDLRRYRAGQPILARPVGPVERAARWARRHPAVTGLLAAIVAGVGLAFWAVKSEQMRTAQERDRAVEAEQEAKENLEQAQKAVDECFGLVRTDPRLQAEALRPVRKLLLEKTLPFYQAFVRRQPDNPALAARQADYFVRVGDITQEIGSPSDALRSYEQARDVYNRLHQQEPANRDYQAQLAWTSTLLGYLQSTTGRPAEAMANYERSAALYEALSKSHPEVGLYQAGLAQAHHNQGMLLRNRGKVDESLRRYRQALAIRKDLAEANPSVARLQADLAHAWNSLGANLSELRNQKEAVASYEKAAALWLKLCQAHPSTTQYQAELASVYSNTAFAQALLGQHDPAERNYRKALSLLGPLSRAHREVSRYQDALANTWNNLGMLQSFTNRPLEARNCYLQARDIYARLHKAYPEVTGYPTRLAGACNNIGVGYRQAGDAAGGLPFFVEAIRLLRAVRRKQPDHAVAAGYLVNAHARRALVLGNLGRHREAADDWGAAWQVGAGANREALLWMQSLSLALAGDHPQADELPDPAGVHPWLRPEERYDLAALFAGLSRSAAGAAGRPLAVRERQAERWARRALAMLDLARQGGHFKGPGAIDRLKKDTAFDPLRPRANFQAWEAGLVSSPTAGPR